MDRLTWATLTAAFVALLLAGLLAVVDRLDPGATSPEPEPRGPAPVSRAVSTAPVGAAEGASLRDRRPEIPLEAVLRDARLAPYCFVVGVEGGEPIARRRPLALGPVRGRRVRVLSGLAPGDRVVVSGQHTLRDGQPLHLGPAPLRLARPAPPEPAR